MKHSALFRKYVGQRNKKVQVGEELAATQAKANGLQMAEVAAASLT